MSGRGEPQLKWRAPLRPTPRTTTRSRSVPEPALGEEIDPNGSGAQAHEPKCLAVGERRDGADRDGDLEEGHAARKNHVQVQMPLRGLLLFLRFSRDAVLLLLVLRQFLPVLLG